MDNYIDVKMTVWNRFHFADESDMAGIADLIKESGLKDVIDDDLGFIASDTLCDTEENLTPEQNGQQPTIEVYANNEMIWDNSKK